MVSSTMSGAERSASSGGRTLSVLGDHDWNWAVGDGRGRRLSVRRSAENAGGDGIPGAVNEKGQDGARVQRGYVTRWSWALTFRIRRNVKQVYRGGHSEV